MTTVRVKSRPPVPDDLDERIVEFAKHKAAAKYHEGQWREAQPGIIESMDDANVTRRVVTDDNVKVTATVVRGSTVDLDPDRLKKAIGAREWNKLTTRMLDPTKVKKAVEDGTLDAQVVAECSTEKPKSPYVKATVKDL